MIHNYTEEISNFITTQLVPKMGDSEKKRLTLNEIYNLVTNVYPQKWIDITDVYEVLSQLGYAPLLDINEKGEFTSFYSFC